MPCACRPVCWCMARTSLDWPVASACLQSTNPWPSWRLCIWSLRPSRWPSPSLSTCTHGPTSSTACSPEPSSSAPLQLTASYLCPRWETSSRVTCRTHVGYRKISYFTQSTLLLTLKKNRIKSGTSSISKVSSGFGDSASNISLERTLLMSALSQSTCWR